MRIKKRKITRTGKEIKARRSKRYICLISLVGIIVVFILVSVQDTKDNSISKIERPEPGEDAKSVELDVYDEAGNKQTTINTYIEPRRMTEQETQKCFDNAYDELVRVMLKDNISVDCITQDIYIPYSLADGLITVNLYPSDYSVIDYDGTVHNESMIYEDSINVSIYYVMQYEEYDRQGVIDMVVRPAGTKLKDGELSYNNANLNSASALALGQNTIQKIVDNTANKDTNEAWASLPDSIADTPVYYRYAGEETPWFIYIVMAVAIVGLVLYKRKTKGLRQQKQRIEELQYDYSELISKLTLLLGAGMTIRKAWEKMVSDYVKRKEAGGEIKAVYEEMYITDCNINAGISEYAAYEEFGHRCNTREYLKLASLLQTNLKRGTNRLRELLYQESYDAFEQRKNLAKQKGEEATTKLLIPMIMMLVVVMVIVMIPAVMSFYLT